MPITTMNQHSYGLLLVQVQGIPNYTFQAKVQVGIELDPFILASTVISPSQPVLFNQSFYVPIHNTFHLLKISLQKVIPGVIGLLAD